MTVNDEENAPTPPSADAYFFPNTMFTVVIQSDQPMNDPPELVSDAFTVNEDEVLEVQLTYYDTANDQVRLWVPFD